MSINYYQDYGLLVLGTGGVQSREEGENEMLWVQEDIDEKVLLWLFLTCVMARDAAMGI